MTSIVVAQNRYRAQLIADRLGLTRPLIASVRTVGLVTRGMSDVDQLIIDDTATLSAADEADLRLTLAPHATTIRYDVRPKPKQ